MRNRLIWVLFIEVLRRPRLWGEALRSVPRLARRHWWRRPPFLPLPDPSYLRWRVATAYGDAAAAVRRHDVIAYLEWCRRQR